jgi:uncharacterized RDD family membrane protein YckC
MTHLPRKLLLIALAFATAGCVGWLSPLTTSDQENFYLLLAGGSVDSEEFETTLYYAPRDGTSDWQQIARLAGRAQSVASWQGRLWVTFPENCCSYQFIKNLPANPRIISFSKSWRPATLQVHHQELWAVSYIKNSLQLSKISKPTDLWQSVGPAHPITETASRIQLISSQQGLWVLYRKSPEQGKRSRITYAARFEDGKWQDLPACDIGGFYYSACPNPTGNGLIVATYGGKLSRQGGALRLYRLQEQGWSQPFSPGLVPTQINSPIMGLALNPGPESRQLMLWLGRAKSIALFRATLPADGSLPREWEQIKRLQLQIHGMWLLFFGMVLISALMMGAGIAIATVRRRRVFPVMPGQPRPAPLMIRTAAWLVDNSMVGAAFFAVPLCTATRISAILGNGFLLLLLLAGYRLLYYLYCATCEARMDATPGKLMFGLRVSMLDGHRPTTKAAIIRNLLRPLDEVLLFPLIGIIAATLSKHGQRLGDRAAGTIVTTENELHEIHEDRRRKSDRFHLPQ